jgi:hypothetical protein
MWFTPFRSEYVVGIKVDDFSDIVSYLVPAMSGNNNDYLWGGSTILPNDKILYVPFYAKQFAIFDPEGATDAERWKYFEILGNGFKFAGAIVSSYNETPYALPYREGGIWKIDYLNATATEVVETGNPQYGPATEGPDQKIYLAPGTGPVMGIFDPSDNSFVSVTVPIVGGGSSYPNHGGGISVASNNCVYLSAELCKSILKLNFNILDASGHPTATAIDISSVKTQPSSNTSSRYGKPQLLGDGKIFFPPIGDDCPILILDPADDSFITYPGNHASGRSIGGNQLPDGKIFTAPYNTSNKIQWYETYQTPTIDVFSPRTNYQQ